jgi:hypothetical protein
MAGQSLEDRVSALETALASLQTLPGEFAAFRIEVRERFAQIDARFGEVDDRFTRLEARITHESEYLYARMRMLHEELIERIERLGESSHGSGSNSPRRRRRPKR